MTRPSGDREDSAKDELEALRRELEESQAREHRVRAELVRSAQLVALGNLVRGVAHEINTPLGALASNHDVTRRALDRLQAILADEQVTADELEEVRRIVRAVDSVSETNEMAMDRMKHIVSSLRTFSRPDRAEIDRIDIAETLRATIALVRHELSDRITVVEDFEAATPVECYGQQVNQVFMNLTMNAIQAMEAGGTLTLRTRALDDRVAVEVSDTGVGISESNLGRIFEPGFTTKGRRMGMGLGLLICSEIVNRHHGEIAARSELGAGTTFTVTLPRDFDRSSIA